MCKCNLSDLPVLVVLYVSQWQDIYFAGIIEKGR